MLTGSWTFPPAWEYGDRIAGMTSPQRAECGTERAGPGLLTLVKPHADWERAAANAA